MRRTLVLLVAAATLVVFAVGPAAGDELSRGQALQACAADRGVGQFLNEVRDVTGLKISPGKYTIDVGTDGNDSFVFRQGEAEMLCGLAGDDLASVDDTVEPEDVFVGGPGDDEVPQFGGQGFFIGGPGRDFIVEQTGGSFYGGADVDGVDELFAGVFDGGDGDDFVAHWVVGGTFNGGAGVDVATVGCGFPECFPDQGNGTFNGGAGDDTAYVVSGTFNGGPGNDIATLGCGLPDCDPPRGVGVFNGNEGDDTVTAMYAGTFDGGPGFDVVIDYVGGICIDVEEGCP